MFVRKKHFNQLVKEFRQLQKEHNTLEERHSLVVEDVYETLSRHNHRLENNRKYTSKVSGRLSQLKPHLRRTFGFLAASEGVDKASNHELAKWLEENL